MAVVIIYLHFDGPGDEAELFWRAPDGHETRYCAVRRGGFVRQETFQVPAVWVWLCRAWQLHRWCWACNSSPRTTGMWLLAAAGRATATL